MKTWHWEILVMAIILSTVNILFANNWINWLTEIAILLTFNHAQIADRLQEKQKDMAKPTVECYHKLNKLFTAKEIMWIVCFILMQNYAAIVGSALISLYPYWRKAYRKRCPVKEDAPIRKEIFECRHCGQPFTDEYDLEAHVNFHHNYKPS